MGQVQGLPRFTMTMCLETMKQPDGLQLTPKVQQSACDDRSFSIDRTPHGLP